MSEEKWVTYRKKSYWKREIQVSNFGNAKIGGKIKQFNLSKGQTYYNLCHEYLHRIIAKCFVPNPDNKPFVDHIDGNPLNNRADNLRWCTQKENLNNPIAIERYKKVNGLPNKHPKSAGIKQSQKMKELWKIDEYRNKVLSSRPKHYNKIH